MKTIDEILVGCEHDGSYIPVSEVKRLMAEYASQFIHPIDCHQCEGTGTVIFPSGATQQCMICKGIGKLIILPTQHANT